MQLTYFSTSTYHLFTLFLAFLVFINNHQTSANSLGSKSDYQQHSLSHKDLSYENSDEIESPMLINANNLYTPDTEEIVSQNPWSQLFHRYSQESAYNPTYYLSPSTGFNLRHGEIRYIPYLAQKRAIPIEFQKALFAHGIVGRRR